MSELVFRMKDAKEAIRRAKKNGENWLYKNYPKPGGQVRRSSTGFLIYEGERYPVKPLGRLANEIAGHPMTDNPITNVFRRHFERLGFEVTEPLEDDAESATERQRRLAEVWMRPRQAKFRRAVFGIFGARCLVTGCETPAALEAAHVLPVSEGGSDEGWNGIPLRADLHRLFDAGVITLDPTTWKLRVTGEARYDYSQYCGLDLRSKLAKVEGAKKLAAALRERAELADRSA